jgi:hypothetical protein
MQRYLLAVALIAACVEREPRHNQPPPPDPATIEKNIFTELPADANLAAPINADLGGKVVYLGAVADKQAVRPGDKLRITHWWKVTEPPGADWRVFTHVVGTDKNDWMNVDYTPMRAGHGPDKWKAGQILRDEQDIVLDGDWKSPHAQIAVGLYRKGSHGVDGRMAIASGPADQERRVLALQLPVLAKDAAAPAPAYTIARASGAIAVDGKADEPAWGAAAWGPPFSDTIGGDAIGQATRAKLLYDDAHLYAFIEATDTDAFSEFTDRDGTLWKADVVELFIDADGNRRGYVELQVNPNNAQLDAWFQTTRHQGSDFEWSAGMTSAVTVRGTHAIRHDTDEGWDVEVAIPLAAVKGRDDAMAVTLPPRPGDTWRVNVVRVDKPRDAKSIRASSWSAVTIQDFHGLDRLATMTFGE